MPVPTAPDRAPAPLTVAASLAGVEGIVLALYGVSVLVSVSRERLTMGLTSGGFFVVLGVVLVVCAWPLSRLRAWARGPVLLVQLLQLGVAWSFHAGGTAPLAWVLALVAVVVLAGLLHPQSLAALDRGGPES